MNKSRPYIFCTLLLFVVGRLDAAQIRILFSSSLNGNLDGCRCRTHPVSGLVKRAAFIDRYRQKHPDVILLDSGDLIADPENTRLTRAVYRAYRSLGYDAVVPGDQDLRAGVATLKRLSGNLPLLAANLEFSPGGVFSSWRAPFPDIKIIKRNGREIRIIGLIHRDAFRFFSPRVKKSLRFQNPAGRFGELKNGNLNIILSHGGEDADNELAHRITGPVLIIGGHDQTLFKPVPGRELRKGIWYFQSGRDGNALGEIVLELKSGNSFEVVSQRLIEFDYRRDPDHPGIRKMIDELKKRHFTGHHRSKSNTAGQSGSTS